MDARHRAGMTKTAKSVEVLKRRERIGKAAPPGDKGLIKPAQDGRQLDTMTAATLFAFASAIFLGAGVVTAQLGLRTVEPLSGAAISVPAFTLRSCWSRRCCCPANPWSGAALPIFAAIGLVFPAMLTFLTFASNRALGPVVTSSLGNLAPLFAVALAVVRLHEPLRSLQLAGLVIAVVGAVIITVTRPRDLAAGGAGRCCCRSRRVAARRGSADRQARARDLAEPAVGLPDRLPHVVAASC